MTRAAAVEGQLEEPEETAELEVRLAAPARAAHRSEGQEAPAAVEPMGAGRLGQGEAGPATAASVNGTASSVRPVCARRVETRERPRAASGITPAASSARTGLTVSAICLAPPSARALLATERRSARALRLSSVRLSIRAPGRLGTSDAARARRLHLLARRVMEEAGCPPHSPGLGQEETTPSSSSSRCTVWETRAASFPSAGGERGQARRLRRILSQRARSRGCPRSPPARHCPRALGRRPMDRPTARRGLRPGGSGRVPGRTRRPQPERTRQAKPTCDTRYAAGGLGHHTSIVIGASASTLGLMAV